MKSNSITRQAGLRLIFSLGLFVLLLGISSYKLYSIALQKSAHERTENLATFYRTRLMQLDRDWDLQAHDFKIRLEVTRLLEDRKTSVTNLQAFMTVQGTNRRFQYMLIQDRKGDKVFDFGNELNLKKIPVSSGVESGWYLSKDGGNLYRVFVTPIWLGAAGNGHMAVFYKIDNALLFNLATPGIELTVMNDGNSIASSDGEAGLDRIKQPKIQLDNIEEREIPWSTNDSEMTFLRIDAPIKALFTVTELTVSAATIPVIDGLILWFTLGFWLMRNARRIKNLGGAVEEFSAKNQPTPMLEEKLNLARDRKIDEISEVASAIAVMSEQIMRREYEREVGEAQRRLWSMVFASGNEAIVITDRDNNFLTVNSAFTRLTGYSEEEVIGKNPRILSSGCEPREFYEAMWQQIKESGFWSGEVFDRRKDGSVYPKWLNISVVRDAAAKVTNYVGAFFDITERKKIEYALQMESKKNIAFLHHASDGVCILNSDAEVIEVSNSFCEMLGYQREELLGRHVSTWDSNLSFAELSNFVRELSSQKKRNQFETYHTRKDGSIFNVEISTYPLELEDKTMLYCSVRDITERKQAEAELRIAAVTFDSYEAIVITDVNANIIRVNKAFCDVTGFSADELLGKNPSVMRSEKHDKAFYVAMWEKLVQTGIWSGEIWDRRKNGEVYLKWTTITAIKNNQQETTHYVAISNDITETRRKDERIHHLAFHDALTNLPNRALIQDRIQHALNRAQREEGRLSVTFIDLDRFKAVNDSLGHDIGDLLLQEVATRIRSRIRAMDTVARLGGDEFVVLMEDLGETGECACLAQELINEISRPMNFRGHVVEVGASMGIAFYPEDGADYLELMKHADLAMYAAKSAGRNTYRFFQQNMQEVTNQRMTMELDLRHAITNGDLELHYQPRITQATGKHFGVEALVRWRNPTLGLLQPNDFIPLAEETGLIVELGAWVLDEACRQSAAWKKDGHIIKIAVNVSVIQLRVGDLVERITELTLRHGITPADLEIELTESAIMLDPDQAKELLTRLRKLGVTVAIDDFGTGYSSLACLRRLPIDVLKIDRSFIMSADTNEEDMQIVKMILALGQTLKLDVVAEGIETSRQADLLQSLGCKMAQGYFFSKPLPANELNAWLYSTS